ncbi:hypothetical protein GCM10008015_07970 [Flavobacterium palustre]|uniref:Uncharacterized protein n=1 Tax=Flavobacterium palustre TaxID=1476463 RepID=A0ABQ1HBW4_9FLAO|nr:hypothetical protein [Flavobacterium palustre]GGA69654.1 hypothetical protein GCM10008015_07970 [Flavobacterium palustre]
MIEYSFKSDSNYTTQKIAEFINLIEPKINYEIEDSHFGKIISCKFEDETERDSFILTLSNSLNISEEGRFLE